jgi:hypothetical protein
MTAVLEAYDRVLHEEPARSVQMAQRLLEFVKGNVLAGKITREEAYSRLEELYEYYADQGCVDEREAVADVLDAFDGWSPLKAAV